MLILCTASESFADCSLAGTPRGRLDPSRFPWCGCELSNKACWCLLEMLGPGQSLNVCSSRMPGELPGETDQTLRGGGSGRPTVPKHLRLVGVLRRSTRQQKLNSRPQIQNDGRTNGLTDMVDLGATPPMGGAYSNTSQFEDGIGPANDLVYQTVPVLFLSAGKKMLFQRPTMLSGTPIKCVANGSATLLKSVLMCATQKNTSWRLGVWLVCEPCSAT